MQLSTGAPGAAGKHVFTRHVDGSSGSIRHLRRDGSVPREQPTPMTMACAPCEVLRYPILLTALIYRDVKSICGHFTMALKHVLLHNICLFHAHTIHSPGC